MGVNCKHCEKPLVRKPKEKPSQLLTRQYCDTKCVNEYKKAHRCEHWPVHPPCLFCGGEVPKRFTEGVTRYLAQEYCCVTCGNRAKGAAKTAAYKSKPKPKPKKSPAGVRKRKTAARRKSEAFLRWQAGL